MKKALFLLLALSVYSMADDDASTDIPFAVNFDAPSETESVAAPEASTEVKSEEPPETKAEVKSKPAKATPKAKAKAKAKTPQKSASEPVAKPEENALENVPAEENSAEKSAEKTAEATPATSDNSVKESTFTLYLHPFNFLVPYSHFWGGVKVPNGFTDYPLFNLTFEWKLQELSSLMTMLHYVSVDRSDDGYQIYDIGLQESYRWYNIGGHRWWFLQMGALLSHLHIATEEKGGFDGWLYGFMVNGGIKKVLNGGEGFLGHFAVSVDVGFGYVWTSDFEGSRKRVYFELDKGLSIDVNAAIGFQI